MECQWTAGKKLIIKGENDNISGGCIRMQKNYPGMFNLTKGLMMIAIMMMHAVTDGLLGYGLNIQLKRNHGKPVSSPRR